MDGNFIGGGGLSHIVSGGRIFVDSEELTTLFFITGARMARRAHDTQSRDRAIIASVFSDIAEKFDELRMELLKREIEASFTPDELTTLFDLKED
jgi:hypothetical protein